MRFAAYPHTSRHGIFYFRLPLPLAPEGRDRDSMLAELQKGCREYIALAEVRTEDGKLYMFVAIDRTSKFVFVELYEKAGKMNAAKFLRHLIRACPYTIHMVLPDNGVQFTERKTNTLAGEHIFDRTCRENKIDHRLTK